MEFAASLADRKKDLVAGEEKQSLDLGSIAALVPSAFEGRWRMELVNTKGHSSIINSIMHPLHNARSAARWY
jgi:hypothetical protein